MIRREFRRSSLATTDSQVCLCITVQRPKVFFAFQMCSRQLAGLLPARSTYNEWNHTYWVSAVWCIVAGIAFLWVEATVTAWDA